MEKLIYALWRKPGQPREAFNAALLGEVADRVGPLVRGLRINVQDATVAEGTSPRLAATDPQMDAFAQLWLDCASPDGRAPVETALASAASRVEGWLVCEATVIANETCPPGNPTEGFSQIAVLQKPSGLDRETWRDNWQNGHSQIAIDTQRTFEYVQNLVVRPVTETAGPYAAIVEECFPMDALTDVAVYFDGVGDADALAANVQRMMESCAEFMEMSGCDCVPMRQYECKSLLGGSAPSGNGSDSGRR